MGLTAKIIQTNTSGNGIENTVQQDELNRLREIKDIEAFRDSAGELIYSRKTLNRLFLAYSSVFKNRPHWTLAQMLAYVIGGYETAQKISFVTSVLRMNDPSSQHYDPAVDKYIERKSQRRYTRRAMLVEDENHIKKDKKLSPTKAMEFKSDIYLSAVELVRITLLSPESIIAFLSKKELDVTGTGRSAAINLRYLIPFLLNTGRTDAAKMLYEAYGYALRHGIKE